MQLAFFGLAGQGAYAFEPTLAIGVGTKPAVFFGSSGDDILIANGAGDQLEGKGGNDILVGGRGRDFLDGGAGNNLIFAGRGDTVWSEGGNDHIVVDPSQGSTGTIMLQNFDPTHDTIDLSRFPSGTTVGMEQNVVDPGIVYDAEASTNVLEVINHAAGIDIKLVGVHGFGSHGGGFSAIEYGIEHHSIVLH